MSPLAPFSGSGSIDVGSFVRSVAVGTVNDFAYSQLNQTGLPLVVGVASQTAAFTSDVYGAFRDVLTPPLPVYVTPPVTAQQVASTDPETGQGRGPSQIQLTGHVQKNPYAYPRHLPPVGARPVRLPPVDNSEYQSRFDWINGQIPEELPLRFSELAEPDLSFMDEFWLDAEFGRQPDFSNPDFDPYTGRAIWRGDGPSSIAATKSRPWLDFFNTAMKVSSTVNPVGQLATTLATSTVNDAVTMCDNTSHFESSWGRSYVIAGTMLGGVAGVRSLSDAFSRHDAIDAHRQSTGERLFDGLTGGAGVVTTALPIGSAATNAFRNAFGRSIVASGSAADDVVLQSSRRAEWADSFGKPSEGLGQLVRDLPKHHPARQDLARMIREVRASGGGTANRGLAENVFAEFIPVENTAVFRYQPGKLRIADLLEEQVHWQQIVTGQHLRSYGTQRVGDVMEILGPSGIIVGRGRESHSRNRSLF